MDKLDNIFWIIGTGFGLILSFLVVIWKKITSTEDSLRKRMDKLDEKVTDNDLRLCGRNAYQRVLCSER